MNRRFTQIKEDKAKIKPEMFRATGNKEIVSMVEGTIKKTQRALRSLRYLYIITSDEITYSLTLESYQGKKSFGRRERKDKQDSVKLSTSDMSSLGRGWDTKIQQSLINKKKGNSKAFHPGGQC